MEKGSPRSTQVEAGKEKTFGIIAYYNVLTGGYLIRAGEDVDAQKLSRLAPGEVIFVDHVVSDLPNHVVCGRQGIAMDEKGGECARRLAELAKDPTTAKDLIMILKEVLFMGISIQEKKANGELGLFILKTPKGDDFEFRACAMSLEQLRSINAKIDWNTPPAEKDALRIVGARALFRCCPAFKTKLAAIVKAEEIMKDIKMRDKHCFLGITTVEIAQEF